MLISKNEILNHQPPFLLQFTNQEWLLVESLCIVASRYVLTIVENENENENENEKFYTRSMHLSEEPFHVGAEVWELDYGATLKTLYHDSLDKHPAKAMWLEWLSVKDQNK